MTDRKADAPIDPERPRGANAFDRPDGYSGQGYTVGREAAEGQVDSRPSAQAASGADLPPDAGRRAGSDPRTGEVYGSGSGIGGGNPGEDFDAAAPSGETYPLTGGEGGDHAGEDLGPAHLKE